MIQCIAQHNRGLSEILVAQHAALVGTPLEPILEPRRIQAPPGYHSTKCISTGLFLLIAQGRIKDELNLQHVPTEITAHTIAYQVINHGLHVFFVRDALARAIAATDLPHDFTLDDLHWPMPGMVIAWPAGFMREAVGRDICYVYAANVDAGDHSVAAMPGCPPSRSHLPKLAGTITPMTASTLNHLSPRSIVTIRLTRRSCDTAIPITPAYVTRQGLRRIKR